MAKRKMIKAGDFAGDKTFKLGQATKYSGRKTKSAKRSSAAVKTSVTPSKKPRMQPTAPSYKLSTEINRVNTSSSAPATDRRVPKKTTGKTVQDNRDHAKKFASRIKPPVPVSKPTWMNSTVEDYLKSKR